MVFCFLLEKQCAPEKSGASQRFCASECARSASSAQFSSPIYGNYMYLNALENAFDFPSNSMGPFSLGRSKFYIPTKEGMTPVILTGFEKIPSGQFI